MRFRNTVKQIDFEELAANQVMGSEPFLHMWALPRACLFSLPVIVLLRAMLLLIALSKGNVLHHHDELRARCSVSVECLLSCGVTIVADASASIPFLLWQIHLV